MRRRLLFACGAPLAALAALLSVGLVSGRAAATTSAADLAPAGRTFTPTLGLPAGEVVAIGASPGAGEVWAYGSLGAVPATVDGVRYAGQVALLEQPIGGSSWQVVPLPSAPSGEPASTNGSVFPAALGGLGGRATSAGGVVLLTGAGIVDREPSGQATLLPEPEPGAEAALLGPGETLPPQRPSETAPTAFAATEEGSATGVLIAPYGDGASLQAGILHFGAGPGLWSREPLVGPAAEMPGFTVAALACGAASGSDVAAASPENCWALASYRTAPPAASPGRAALFRRAQASGGGFEWLQVETGPGSLLGEAGGIPTGFAVGPPVPTSSGTPQVLTVTSQGVWADLEARHASTVVDLSELLTPSGPASAGALGAWCYPSGELCPASHGLGAPFPPGYRSFAWPGEAGSPGERLITGLPNRTLLQLEGEGFVEEVGPGGTAGSADGAAAFVSPTEGWIADDDQPSVASDGQGQSQVIEVGGDAGDQLGSESVPFRRPLYALAQAPGTSPGDPGAEALAVGEAGQVGRYVPGQGWRPESLLGGEGAVQRPTLRGVAWPEAGRAYAVGDNGAMWTWRAGTGLWEPDPGKPPNFIGSLTALAFDPGEPDLGYAVGRQGVLLRFGKGWEQEPLPAALAEANFTSVSFAGSEALATYRTIVAKGSGGEMMETGGIAVSEAGGPWHLDPAAAALLAELPETSRVLSRVAGLPDGGAVAAGPGLVIEREGAGAPWQLSPQPLPEAQDVSALAAYREAGGPVRAIVSIDLDRELNPELGSVESSPYRIDLRPPAAPGRPPVFLGPDLLPNSGYLVKQTAAGWADLEHAALPAVLSGHDLPLRPDPVLALSVAPDGETGLAVGGQTGDVEGLGPKKEVNPGDLGAQTAAATRFPASAASTDGAAAAPTTSPITGAAFAVGGQAACVEPCGALAADGIGPEVWLRHAGTEAAQFAAASGGALRGLLYTGAVGGEDVFARDLGSLESSLPAYGPAGASAAEPGPPGTSAYSFRSEGSGGPVEVIDLDFSSQAAEEEQLGWLEERLAAARGAGVPAIVLGTDSLGFVLPQPTDTAPQLAPSTARISAILLAGGASAYLFDYPEANVKTTVGSGVETIPAFGTGTLGYVSSPDEEAAADSLGQTSGFLLLEVHGEGHGGPAAVSARVVPDIGQLALDATDGTLLRRSHVALFEALARRPQGGTRTASTANGIEVAAPDPYDQIPSACQGPNCSFEVEGEYAFSSSEPVVGDFVAHDPTSANPRQVLLGANQLPVPDPHSGLFCAYNAGTTTVSVTTGGLTYSEPVTVQAGSVQYPCGTVPLRNPPAAQPAAAVPPAEFPTSPQVRHSPGPVPVPPPPPAPIVPPTPVVAPTPPPPLVPHHPPAPIAAITPPFFAATPAPVPIVPIVPPPAPPAAQPTPPSGTSPVTQPVTSPSEQEDQEAAVQHVHHAVARPLGRAAFEPLVPHHAGGLPPYLPGLVALLALAGAGAASAVRERRRRPRPALELTRPRSTRR